MIGSLRGQVLHKTPGSLLLEVNGTGYEITLPIGAFERIPSEGEDLQVFVVESVGLYGGGVSLYGFLSLEEKQIFLLLREVPGTGAKKALEYLDKIATSFPDFRRAVLERDVRVLMSLFGFTRKTSDKLIAALHERLMELRPMGRERWSRSELPNASAEALVGLLHLGYRESEARSALERIPREAREGSATGDLIREALKHLS